MREVCLATAMFSYGIAYRRHVSAFISSGEKTRSLIEGIKDNRHSIVTLITENIVPLTGVNYATYSPYKEDDTSGIYVFRRRDPYTPVRLAKLGQAKIAPKLAGESYAKLVIFFPFYESYSSLVDRVELDNIRQLSSELWNTRRGKLERVFLDGRNPSIMRLRNMIEEYCGMDRKTVKDVFENSRNHAIAIASGLQAEP